MKKLVVFDWNGTLLADTIVSWKAGNVCFEYHGVPAPSFKKYLDTFTFPVIHFYKKNGISVDEILEHKDHTNVLFQETYEELAKNARTRRGARHLLQWINDNDLDCMILSNYRTPRIKAQLQRLKIENHFDHVCAHNCDGTTILENTTKTERLKRYMSAGGYKAEDTIIIGDSAEEPEIGRLLGLNSVGITGGYISTARLRAAKPDHIVHNLLEFKALLRDKWGLAE